MRRRQFIAGPARPAVPRVRAQHQATPVIGYLNAETESSPPHSAGPTQRSPSATALAGREK